MKSLFITAALFTCSGFSVQAQRSEIPAASRQVPEAKPATEAKATIPSTRTALPYENYKGISDPEKAKEVWHADGHYDKYLEQRNTANGTSASPQQVPDNSQKKLPADIGESKTNTDKK
jgi:hypothetical protein